MKNLLYVFISLLIFITFSSCYSIEDHLFDEDTNVVHLNTANVDLDNIPAEVSVNLSNESFYKDFLYLYGNKMYNQDVLHTAKNNIDNNYLCLQISTLYSANQRYMLRFVQNVAILYLFQKNEYEPIFLISYFANDIMIRELVLRGYNNTASFFEIVINCLGRADGPIEKKLEIFYIEFDQIHLAFESTLQSMFQNPFMEEYTNSLIHLSTRYTMYYYDDIYVEDNDYKYFDEFNIKVIIYDEAYYYKNLTGEPDETKIKTEYYRFNKNTKKFEIVRK